MSALIGYLPEHFNPLPRKEGDVVQYTYCEDGIDISIHSLVKRETGRKFAVDAMDDGISIHSLVKRETSGKQLKRKGVIISIHSLVKRETSTCRYIASNPLFQSTPS